jgi:hypothetical protein
MKKKIILLIGLILVMSLSVAFAASRHTKETAIVRHEVTITEGQTFGKTISCYDPDGDTVTITVEDLPAGAVVAAQVTQPEGYTDPDLPAVPADAPNAKWYTRVLTWTPTYQQSGTYTIFIHAVDASGDDDWVKYVITVTNTNRPPVL